MFFAVVSRILVSASCELNALCGVISTFSLVSRMWSCNTVLRSHFLAKCVESNSRSSLIRHSSSSTSSPA